MSIYSTLWTLKFPMYLSACHAQAGLYTREEQWAEVFAQGVYGFIREELPFLPSPITDDDALRAVVIVCERWEEKGTTRSGQEYQRPLLVFSGEEYAALSFEALYEQIMKVLSEHSRHIRIKQSF